MEQQEKEELLGKLVTELKLKGSSELTVRNYSWFIAKFLSQIDKPGSEINEDDARNFLASMIDSKSRNTTSLAASALRFFFSTILKKPIMALPMPKKEKNLPEGLTKEEVRKIIESAQTSKSRLIIKLLYSAGLRVSELVNLKKQDINLEEGVGWVRRGKGRKDRFFIVAEKIAKELKKQMEKQPTHLYIFSTSTSDKPLTPRNIQKIIKKTALKAEIIKKVSPHTLRNSYSTHLLESGTDIRKIQALLGHANLNTAQLYTHIPAEELKKIKSPLDEL